MVVFVLNRIKHLAVIGDGTFNKGFLAYDGLQKSRLSGTIGTNESNDFTFVYIHGNTSKGLDVSIVDADVIDSEKFFVCHSSSSSSSSSFPRYASITAGLDWISCAVPWAIFCP